MLQLPTTYADYVQASVSWGEPQETPVTGPGLSYYPTPGLWVKTQRFFRASHDTHQRMMERELKAMEYYGYLQCHTPSYTNLLAYGKYKNPKGQSSDDPKRIFILEHIEGTILNDFLKDETIDMDVRKITSCDYVTDRLPTTIMTANMDDNASNVVVRKTPYVFSKAQRIDPFTSLDVDKTLLGTPCHNCDYALMEPIDWSGYWSDTSKTDKQAVYMMKRNLLVNTGHEHFIWMMDYYLKQYVMAAQSGQLKRDDMLQSFYTKMDALTENKTLIDANDYSIMQRRASAAVTYLKTADLPLMQ